MQLCKDNEIRLFVFVSPAYYMIDEINKMDWSKIIEQKCQEYSIPFFNYEQDSIFLSHPEWFYNSLHLNDVGAREYTQKVVNDINI